MKRFVKHFPVIFFCAFDFLLWKVDEIWKYYDITVQTDIYFIAQGVRLACFFIAMVLLGNGMFQFERTSLRFFIFYALFALINYGIFVYNQL